MPHHFVKAITEPCRCCQFGPQFHPLSGLFVDLLLTDFDTYIADQCVTDVIDPVVRGAFCASGGNRRQIDLEEELTQELGLAGDQTAQALAELESTVELDGNRFDGKGRVAAIDLPKEGRLRLAGKINILTPARDQLEWCGRRHCSLRGAAVCGCA